jgi:hypothetical protein
MSDGDDRTTLGMTWPADRGAAFPVAPAEAFRGAGALRVGGRPARPILDLGAGPRAAIEPRLPPPSWRRGVPLPPAMVRDDNPFVGAWVGVAPLADCHGDVGLLDPEAVYEDHGGAPLPEAGALASEAAALLRELPSLMAMPVERRLLVRIGELADRSGVGSAAGIRLRLGLTHVQWPLLVGADADALVAAFERLVARGLLLVEGRSLIVPWEAWAVYARA